MSSYDEGAAIEAADDREARRTGGTFAQKYLGPADDWDGMAHLYTCCPARPDHPHTDDCPTRPEV